MEKQKVFWVVLAVSVFVVIVLIVGVLLLRQHPAGAPRATVTPMNENGTQPYEYQRQEPLTQPSGPQATAPGSGAPGTPGGDQQTMHFYIGEGAPSASSTPGGAAGSAPAAPSTTGPTGTPAAPGAPGAVTAVTPAAPPAAAAAPLKPKTPRPAAAAAPKTQYWIQAGAYKSQDHADDLVKLLESKGLSGRVFSYLSKNETWYRVRVGPYSNRGEAGKFLSLVKQVQGLEASYISMVAPRKSAVN